MQTSNKVFNQSINQPGIDSILTLLQHSALFVDALCICTSSPGPCLAEIFPQARGARLSAAASAQQVKSIEGIAQQKQVKLILAAENVTFGSLLKKAT